MYEQVVKLDGGSYTGDRNGGEIEIYNYNPTIYFCSDFTF